MSRELQARNFIESQFSGLENAKLATLYVGSKLGIPGASKSFKRRVINLGANRVMDIGTKLIADRLKKNRSKSLAVLHGSRAFLNGAGVDSLGKMIIK